MTRLVVALGNPGKKYKNTRHNIGQSVLDCLGDNLSLFWKSKFKGLYSLTEVDGEKVVFLMPETYMNLSGESVILACSFFKVPIENVLVIHDDIDLPLGTISFKNGGGLAGHNGLRSISSILGSQDFPRLRLGVGRPTQGDVSSWVLSEYSADEKIIIEDYFTASAQAIMYYLENGLNRALKEFQKKNLIHNS